MREITRQDVTAVAVGLAVAVAVYFLLNHHWVAGVIAGSAFARYIWSR